MCRVMCNTCTGVLLCCAWLFLHPNLRAESPPAASLDPALPYQAKRSNPVTYDVDYSVVVTAPYHTRRLKVWLPLPQTDRGQEVQEVELSTFPVNVQAKIANERVFDNKFAYFEFDHPQGGQMIRHRFKIKIWELRWELDPAKVVAVRRWPSAFDRFLKSDHSVVVDD